MVVREGHHVWTSSHVDFISMSPKVVGGVIHGHCKPLLKAVSVDENLIALLISELRRFGIILLVEDSGKEVVRELWNEILVRVSKLAPRMERRIPSGLDHSCIYRTPIGRD